MGNVESASVKNAGAHLSLARHVVLIAGALALYAVLKPGEWIYSLVGGLIGVFGVAAVVTGLALLFFTRREKGRSAATFRNAAWAVVATLSIGTFVPPLLDSHAGTKVAPPVTANVALPAATVEPSDAATVPAAENDAATQNETAAIIAIIERAKRSGELDYAADLKAQRQFDAALGLLVADRGNTARPFAELVQEAHAAVLARRGIGKAQGR